MPLVCSHTSSRQINGASTFPCKLVQVSLGPGVEDAGEKEDSQEHDQGEGAHGDPVRRRPEAPKDEQEQRGERGPEDGGEPAGEREEPKNSPSFSGGESATSITRLLVHVLPNATPTRGPARNCIDGPTATEASRIEINQSARIAMSTLLGPALSVANPAAADPTTANTTEKSSRFLTSGLPIPKTL
jgi:hypothetical protein